MTLSQVPRRRLSFLFPHSGHHAEPVDAEDGGSLARFLGFMKRDCVRAGHYQHTLTTIYVSNSHVSVGRPSL